MTSQLVNSGVQGTLSGGALATFQVAKNGISTEAVYDGLIQSGLSGVVDYSTTYLPAGYTDQMAFVGDAAITAAGYTLIHRFARGKKSIALPFLLSLTADMVARGLIRNYGGPTVVSGGWL